MAPRLTTEGSSRFRSSSRNPFEQTACRDGRRDDLQTRNQPPLRVLTVFEPVDDRSGLRVDVEIREVGRGLKARHITVGRIGLPGVLGHVDFGPLCDVAPGLALGKPRLRQIGDTRRQGVNDLRRELCRRGEQEVMSDKSELVSVFRGFVNLGGKLPPFFQRGGTVFLEPVALVEMSFEIEVIVD
ncbi:hypothetical protein V0U35_00200 [Hyphobacterium sp. Y6023]|uniref:RidA family protein n=1 Tax=Hyphobacterium marinum TaxID=3116574 RepID=A0ABU7LU37_9PROT|nr:hypothetical protein [Hyphobacterium sp. Y6023]MEE2565086.1 hypothetical protein [Hyphobacterium sp. Y6023]